MANSKEQQLPPEKLQIGIKKTLMTTLFAGTGAFVTFRPLYLSTVISTAQVGQIMLIGSVITTFTNPIISAIADSMQAQKALMLLSTAGQAATQLAMLAPGIGYTGQLVLCTLHSLVGAHGFPTLDASIHAVCPERYGEIRLLGSAAFGLAAFGGGGLITLAGNQNAGIFTAFGVASALQIVSLPLITRMDFSALHNKPPPAAEDATKPKAPSGIAAFVKVSSSPKFLFFMAIVFLSGWQNSLIDSYLTIHLDSMGASGVLMGTARLLTCVAELPAFRMSGQILKALGVSGSFALAQLAFVVRFLWYAKLDKIAKMGPWCVALALAAMPTCPAPPPSACCYTIPRGCYVPDACCPSITRGIHYTPMRVRAAF
jgi:PPP family 3-phenylpropionic acid transporter